FHGVFAGANPVHGEQLPVALHDDLLDQPLDGFRDVQVHRVVRGAYDVSFVANRLRGTGTDVVGQQVPERGVAARQEVVPLRFGDLVGRSGIALLLGDPHPAVVAQAFAHEGELGLALSRLGQARGMNLGETRLGEESALLVAPPYRGRVAVDRVG